MTTTSFNQYVFLSVLNEEIKAKINNKEFAEHYDIQDFIREEIETACIYYSDCFDIIKALNFTDFTGLDYEITNITQAAYCALSEFLDENLDWSELEITNC
jgi:hypothetical protein